jgi:hypothetical protein
MQEDTPWGLLIVHPSKTESTNSAPNKALTHPWTHHLQTHSKANATLTTRLKMQGPHWIQVPHILTMLIINYYSKEKAYSLLIKLYSLTQLLKHWFPNMLIPNWNLKELLSNPWSRWAALPMVVKRSDSNAILLDNLYI